MPSSYSVTVGELPPEEFEARPVEGRADDLSMLLTNDRGVTELLATIVQVAAGASASFRGASVSVLTDGHHYETTHASSDQIRAVDESQYAADAGPCVDAIRTGEEVRSAIPSARAWACSASSYSS